MLQNSHNNLNDYVYTVIFPRAACKPAHNNAIKRMDAHELWFNCAGQDIFLFRVTIGCDALSAFRSVRTGGIFLVGSAAIT
jgi:hypothetical protein